MPDATERLLNLAMYLASAGPATAAACRAEVAGYPSGQDDDAFARMFERDKDALRAAGIVIRMARDEDEAYEIDTAATFAREIEIDDEARAALRAAGRDLLEDPGFPMRDALRRALLKLQGVDALELAPRAGSAGDQDEGAAVAALAGAVSARKTTRFAYARPGATATARTVEPYGLFVRAGAWYLVGRDVDKEATRTYAVSRMSDPDVEAARPKTPDFDRPAGFAVGSHLRLPFQFGDERLEASVRFDVEHAWRGSRLSAGRGTLEHAEDGTVTWRVDVSDRRRFLAWLIENGPGLTLLGPPSLVDELARGLRRVVEAHDG